MSTQGTIPQVDPSSPFQDWNAGIPDGETWHFDAMHFPYPMAPLSMSVLSTSWVDGATRGLQSHGIPIRAWKIVGRNHYRFERQEIAEFGSEEEARLTGEAIGATVQREAGQLLQRWNADHLPEARIYLAQLQRLADRVPASDNLPGIVDEALAVFSEIWRIHFMVVIPMSSAMQIFDEFYVDLFGGTQEDGHPLLAGQLNESVKAGIGLSDLADRARNLGLAAAIRDQEPDAALETLSATVEGREFLVDLADYLETYGLRQDLFDLATPTWLEQPAFAITNIRNYLRTGVDARAHHAEISTRAHEARERARAELARYPQPVRDQFEAMLAMGEAASFLQEEHNFYLDQLGFARLRLFFVAIGQRLVSAGAIAAPDDVFMLSIDEIRAALAAPASLHDIVTARRRELEAASQLNPPPFIGTPPSGPPPSATPGDRGMIRFFGMGTSPSGDPGRVMGNPGARGTATGPARVVKTLEEAASLQPGEILVTVTTMPPWSPLFAIAAGVVTETGGPLSHCAIVAREYGIPAVVGAANAMRRIETGQVITIDGSTGTVDLHA